PDGKLRRASRSMGPPPSFETRAAPAPQDEGGTALGGSPNSKMTAASLALIGATIVLSSFISGVFGMAGGMVLLGVLLVYFDVATGMVLFSLIQLATNGWRSLHWRQFVLWPIFYRYVAGAVL